jgi:uncharacterized coiled-coil protein SlyX
MYRVRDDATNPPTKCPVCGGPLRAAAGSSVNLASPARVKELEDRVQELEKERAQAQERMALLERDLADRRSSSPSALSFENSEAAVPRAKEAQDLRQAAERADKLQRELFDLRTDSERRQKEKDRQASESRAALDREQAERRKLDTRLSGLEETHARAIEGKEKTIQALDASLASYRGKLESLQKKLDAVELQRLADLNAFESRVRERDQKDRDELDRVGGAHQKALTDLRGELEQKITEKDRAITESRQSLDREAAERRRLSEVLTRLQETADREVAERDATIASFNTTIGSYKSKIAMLEKRLDDLDQIRRAEQDQLAARLRSRENIRARLDEAGHLASDFEHSLDSMETQLGALRDRVKRLKASLEAEADSEPAAPLSLAAAAYATAPPAPPEDRPAPVLSQADTWSQMMSSPPAEHSRDGTLSPEEPSPESAGAAPALEEAPAIQDLHEAEPVREPEPAELIEPLPARMGRVQEPSGVMRTLESEPLEPEAPSPELSEPSASEPARAGAEEPADLPLISHPDEEERTPPSAPAPKGSAEEEAGPAVKKKPFLSRFSWNRKK